MKAAFTRMSVPILRLSTCVFAGSLVALLLLSVATVASDIPKHKQPSSAAEARFAEARNLLNQGLPEKALGAVRDGLKLSPNSVDGYNLLGIIYGQQKDYPHALAAFQQALKLNPQSTVTRNNLGMSYFSQRKFDLAEHEFRTTLQLNPQDHNANYNLGLMFLARGNYEQAITFLGRVRPPDLPSILSLAEAYFRSGRTTKALEVSRSLSDKAKDDVKLHFSLGLLLASEKQYEPAVHEFELADALMPGTLEIVLNLGQAYLRAGNEAKAEETLNRALALKPDTPETLCPLGRLYTDQQRHIQAMEVLLKARKLAPQSTEVIFLLARVSMLQYYFEDAIQLLETGVTIDPQRPDLHAALGESYFTVGKIDKALHEFETLIRLDPSPGSYNFMGLCYRHRGQFEEAKKYFQEGLKLNPRYAPCLFNLGYIENKEGNSERAAYFLGQAVQLDPNYGPGLYELAAVRMSQKRYEEALSLLQRCRGRTSQPARVYYKLSVVERALHQTAAAERDLKVFETLSKEPTPVSYPFQDFIESFDQRTQLPPEERTQVELKELLDIAKRNPDHPSTLYLLAETYLKRGERAEAMKWVAELDNLSGGDVRTALGVGVLLARYGMHAEAIRHFQLAVATDPTSDDAKYDLANAYFGVGDYVQALSVIQQASPSAQSDDKALALLGDTYAHLGQTAEAIRIFDRAVQKNTENENCYLSLAMAHLRAGDDQTAERVLQEGLSRIPNSPLLFWGVGVVSALDGKAERAEEFLNKGIDLMPEWVGGYSVLGLLYFESGQITKARETMNRCTRFSSRGQINIESIQQALAAAGKPAEEPREPRDLSPGARNQLRRVALALADQHP
jgi:tetratricopeptide (TPR) repeat protein